MYNMEYGRDPEELFEVLLGRPPVDPPSFRTTIYVYSYTHTPYTTAYIPHTQLCIYTIYNYIYTYILYASLCSTQVYI